jgi:ABC-type long-subunit fatty acid transport system fused permease/ATPase subunit
MLLYLHDGPCMFWQNNAILREQLGSFLSYFNVSMVEGKSWNVWYRPVCRRIMHQTVMEHKQVHLVVFHHSSVHNTGT